MFSVVNVVKTGRVDLLWPARTVAVNSGEIAIITTEKSSIPV